MKKAEIEANLIAKAHQICKLGFMDYPDYDEDIELTLADALTVIAFEQVSHDEELTSADLFDFFTEKLG